MKEKVFGTEPSNWIMAMYWVILIFLFSMTLVFCPIASMEPPVYQILVFILSIIILLFILMIFRAYRTRYIITKDQLIIKGILSWTIDLKEIKSVKKTLLPIGIRLFGASFLGGIYYIPSIGKVRMSMTNFKDGILIKTKDKRNFIITPEDPKDFIKALK